MKKAHAERQRGRPGVWIFLGISIFAYGKSEILAEASTIFHNIIKSSVFLEKAETKKEDKPKTKNNGLEDVLRWDYNDWSGSTVLVI